MEILIDLAWVLLVGAAVAVLVLGSFERWLAPWWAALRRASADGPRGAAGAFVKWIGRANARVLPPRIASLIDRRVEQTGDAASLSASEVVALAEIGAVVGLAMGLFAFRAGIESGWTFAAPGLLGAALPFIWLDEQVKRRQLAITRALPFSLDLLTLAVEAGLDFASALGRVVEKARPGPLRDELEFVTRLLKMGRTREEALKTLAGRVKLVAVSRFVSAVVQADRMGSGLAQTLRIQADQLRMERSHRAEKLANQAPVKLLFPLVVFIFPNVFAVLFGPIVFALLGL